MLPPSPRLSLLAGVLRASVVATAGTWLVGCGEVQVERKPAPALTASERVERAGSPFAAVEDAPPEKRTAEAKLPGWLLPAIQPDHFLAVAVQSREIRNNLKAAGVWESVAREARRGADSSSNPLLMVADERVVGHCLLCAADHQLVLTRLAKPAQLPEAQAINLQPGARLEIAEKSDFQGRPLWRLANHELWNCQLDEQTLATSDLLALRKTLAWWPTGAGKEMPLAVASAALKGDEVLSAVVLREPAEPLLAKAKKEQLPFADHLAPWLDAVGSIDSATLSVRDLPLSVTVAVNAIDSTAIEQLRATAEKTTKQTLDSVRAALANAHQPGGAVSSAQQDLLQRLDAALTNLDVKAAGRRLTLRASTQGPFAEWAESLLPGRNEFPGRHAANPAPESGPQRR